MKRIFLILLFITSLFGCASSQEANSSVQLDVSTPVSVKETGILDTADQSIYKDTAREYTLHSLYLDEENLVIDLILDSGCSSYVEYTFKNFTINGTMINFKKCDFSGEINKKDGLHHHYITLSKEYLISKGIEEIEFIYFEFYYTANTQTYGDSYLFSVDSIKANTYLDEIKNTNNYFSEHQYMPVDWAFTVDTPLDQIQSFTEASSFEFDYWLTTNHHQIYKVTKEEGTETSLSSAYYTTADHILVSGNLFIHSSSGYIKDNPQKEAGYSLITNVPEANVSYFRIQPNSEYYNSTELYENERYAYLASDGIIYSVDTRHISNDEEEIERSFINKKQYYSFQGETVKQISSCYLMNQLGFELDGYILFILTDQGYYYQTIQGEYVSTKDEKGKDMINYTVTLVKDEFISSIADRVQLIFNDYLLLDDGRIFQNQNTFCNQITIK